MQSSEREYPRPHHPMQSELVAVLDNGQKIKRRVPRMRACDEKNAKGKPCAGHLKRWDGAEITTIERWGSEIYRCERCHTLYLPDFDEISRTRVLRW